MISGPTSCPSSISRAHVVAYDSRDLNRKSVRYWRDVGAIDAYYEVNMDMGRSTRSLTCTIGLGFCAPVSSNSRQLSSF
jgi:ADP-glucose pyrophosphorylase